jgi:hypothetical protein
MGEEMGMVKHPHFFLKIILDKLKMMCYNTDTKEREVITYENLENAHQLHRQ